LWFESNFLSTIVRELHDLGHEVRVEFEPDGEPPLRVESEPAAPAPALAAPPPPPPALRNDEVAIEAPDSASLNPRYTFETFVAGPSNQLAFAASQAAASSYPPKYNPVFVC